MNILIGPLEEFQFVRLREQFSPLHSIYPVYLSKKKVFSKNMSLGALSQAFEAAYFSGLDAVVNLNASIDVNWSKFKSQVLLGVLYHENKFSIECLTRAYDYDLVFCKSEPGLDYLRRWGIPCDLMFHLPEADPVLKEREPSDDLPYLYDVCFQGNLSNDAVCEYPDRHATLRELWNGQKGDPGIKMFVHSQFMLTREQSLRAYKQSKVVFRDAQYFQSNAGTHGIFVLKVWQMRRPVLFWYAKEGASLRYGALRDGYNCILYNETNIQEKLQSVLANETRRMEIVENAYKSIPDFLREIYGSTVRSIETHLDNAETLTRVGSRRTTKLHSVYYSSDTDHLSAQYWHHYGKAFFSDVAFFCELLGNPYGRTSLVLETPLLHFLDFLKREGSTRHESIGLMFKLSYLLSSITLVLVRLVDNRLSRQLALQEIEALDQDLRQTICKFSRGSRGTTSAELTRAFQLFRPFSGPRDRKHFYELDFLVTQFGNPGNFAECVLSFYERAFVELYGDAAVLCGELSTALEYYKRSGETLRGQLPSYRCDLKAALIAEDRAAVKNAVKDALKHEPLNKFYTAADLEQVVTEDATHPGEGIGALDCLIFGRLVKSWTDPILSHILERELHLESMFQATHCVLAPKKRKLGMHVNGARLATNVIFSSAARQHFARLFVMKCYGRTLALKQSLTKRLSIISHPLRRIA